ncbi:MAG: lipid A deacylase LpxR family protein [Sphingobacteriaceae bacterium]|nr:lipid A deacylase LpxR family protein [Sphingobacteriaceae bacterium]
MRRVASTYLICVLFTVTAFGQAPNYKSEFGFRSDNDSFLAYGQDQYYTNGLFISYRHALKQENLHSKIAKKIWEIEAGQYLFNPFTGKIVNQSLVDRPFAAYLYAGGKFTWFLKTEQIIDISLNAGTIGPDAQGEEVQKGLHDVIGFYPIMGWEYQVNNEVGVNTSLKYSDLIARTGGNDLSLNTYLNLGNTFTGAGIGILYRTGQINDFLSSVSNNSRISNSINDSIPRKELFFFTRPMLNFVGYDATIQGGLFTNNKGPVTFDPKRFQYSHEIGVNYAVNRWTLNFSVLFKSRDVKTQRKPHQYGSVMMYYRFSKSD